MKNIDFAKVMGWFGFILHCPVCHAKYRLQNIKVLESEENEGDDNAFEMRLLIHSDCQKCKSSVIFNTDITNMEIITVAAPTDLTSDDSTKFRDSEPITADDCIAIHQSLKKFDGDLVKALR